MPDHFIDRGTPIQGIEKTARDNRVPFSIPRSMKNLSLPDQRLVRRPGFAPHGDKVHRQQLAKTTGVASLQRLDSADQWRSEIIKTPLSYGLLRWHDDFQPKSTRDWTLEFTLTLGDKEGLVIQPFQRRGKLYNPPSTFTDVLLRPAGVYVYDQSVLAQEFVYDDGTMGSPGTRWNVNDDLYDVHALTSLAIGFNETSIFVTGGVVGLATHSNPGDYLPTAISLSHTLGTYTVGDTYHLAVTYSSSSRILNFYVNGVAANAASQNIILVNYGFCGEYDKLNGNTLPIQRDIVLLNEFTVRGGYASTVNNTESGLNHNYQSFYHAYDASGGGTDATMPWCLSPPRGTGMRDLRFWHQELSSGEVSSNVNVRESPVAVTNLKGQWALDDGGTICRMWSGISGYVEGVNDITLHHTYPGFVEWGLHDLGLRFADGQHLILSMENTDPANLVADWTKPLATVFGYDTRGAAASEKHLRVTKYNDFTVQMQVRPTGFQQEITKHSGAHTQKELLNSTGTATRQKLRFAGDATSAGGAQNYQLTDGNKSLNLAPDAKDYITGADNPDNGLNTEYQSHRGFDQTLFSIEGTGDYTSFVGVDLWRGDGERQRLPVARGLIDPDGYVVFELYKSHGVSGSNQPCLVRLRSATQLSANTTYVITFVQRTIFDATATTVESNKYQAEIWIWDESAGGAKPTVPNSARLFDATWVSGPTSFKSNAWKHVPDYDVIIGASYVNHGWDQSISNPLDNASGTQGPWRIPQHFMSPWHDQALFADVGYFRFWTNSLEQGDMEAATAVSIAKADYTPDLLFNLEIEEISGSQIKNKSRYPVLFDMGYKGWGTPQGYRDKVQTDGLEFFKEEMLPGAWAMEDCLGWHAVVDANYDNKQAALGSEDTDKYLSTEVRLLAPYQSTLTQAYGLLVGYNDALRYDDRVDGTMVNIALQGGGCLNEFVAGEVWRGTPIGDRTILTGRGGRPKVFNGRNLSYAGFKKWSGGRMALDNSPPASAGVGGSDGSMALAKWFGYRVVYYDESDSIFQVSPVSTIFTSANGHANPTTAVRLSHVAPHYDPRVTSIRIYRTLAQNSEDLAKNSAFFPDAFGLLPNRFIGFLHSIAKDEDLRPAPLDLNRTEFPQVQYGASYNGRLWLAGDPIIPDIIYYSDPGNPESVDTVEKTLIIEEGSGDKITGLIAAYGSLYVFKINSIWRISDVGGNRFQVDKVANVGAVSDRSLIELVIPDTGRVAIFFWSQHGPHLYDGSTVQYLGRSIEEQDQSGEALSEYAWLEPRTTIALHDIRRREIVVIYQPKFGSPRVRSDSHSHAVVFNYRSRGWYRYTGTLGTLALSQSFSGGTYTGFFGTVSVGPAASTIQSVEPVQQPNRGETNVYHAFLGGQGGQLYKWAEGRHDGIGDPEITDGFENPYLVSGYSAASKPHQLTFAITGANEVVNKSLSKCWATIYQTGVDVFFTVRVEEIRVSGSTVTLFLREKTIEDQSYPFTPNPANFDLVYLAQTPAEVEFPWDILAESPDGLMDDKHILRLITWHHGNWTYRTQRNYDSSTETGWTLLANAAGKQAKTDLNVSAEALKLKLSSPELEAALDAYGYTVRANRRSTMPK